MGSKSKEIVAVAAAAAAALPPSTTEHSITIKDGKKNSFSHSEAKPPAKKKGGAMRLIRVALFMLRRRGSGKNKSKSSIPVEVASAGMFNKVVGSMRPLHAQSDKSPQHEIVAATMAVAALPSPPVERFEDVLLASPVSTLLIPESPSHSSMSDGCPSRYASAMNLQELDKTEDDSNADDSGNDNDRAYSDGNGDEMIDAKAEEFITQFYQQMRMQNYNERIRREARHHHHN